MAQHYEISSFIVDPNQPTWTKEVYDEILYLWDDKSAWNNISSYEKTDTVSEYRLDNDCFNESEFLSKTYCNDNNHSTHGNHVRNCDECKWKFKLTGNCIAVITNDESIFCNCKKCEVDDDTLEEHHEWKQTVKGIYVVV